MRTLAIRNYRQLQQPVVLDRQHTEIVWKILENTRELVKNAETKAVATLAASGVLGQILILLPHNPHHGLPLMPFAVCRVGGAGLAICASVFSACALWPRTCYPGPAPNLMYFSTAPIRSGQTQETYRNALTDLAGDTDRILDHLAAQIWANATIAHRKFQFTSLAVGCIAAAAITLIGAELGAYGVS